TVGGAQQVHPFARGRERTELEPVPTPPVRPARGARFVPCAPAVVGHGDARGVGTPHAGLPPPTYRHAVQVLPAADGDTRVGDHRDLTPGARGQYLASGAVRSGDHAVQPSPRGELPVTGVSERVTPPVGLGRRSEARRVG